LIYKGAGTKCTTMKTLTVNGVPYDSTNTQLYIYGSNKSLQIGTYQDTLILNDGWKTSQDINAFLTTYRKGLKEATTAALKKAAELQMAQ
jgi:hypothetical protein